MLMILMPIASLVLCKVCQMAISTIEAPAQMPNKRLPTETVRIKADLARMLRIICAVNDTSAIEYLDDKLRAALERDYSQAAKKLSKGAGKPSTGDDSAD